MVDKPIITNFNTINLLDDQKYKRYLPTAFDESLSLLEKVNKVIESQNVVIDSVNEALSQMNSVETWALGDGLQQDVNNKLDTMANDGTLDKIINVDMIGTLSNLKTTQTDNLVDAINDNHYQITESAGYGVINGLNVEAQATPNMSVIVNAGIIHLANGKRYDLAQIANLAVTASDASQSRTDIIYVSKDGIITYLAGALGSGVPATPTDGFKIAEISVSAGVTSVTNSDITDKRTFKENNNQLASQLTDGFIDIMFPPPPMVGAKGNGTDETAVIQNIHNALVAGQTLLIPKGTFVVQGLDLFRDDIWIDCKGVFELATASGGTRGYAVRVGKTVADNVGSFRINGNLNVQQTQNLWTAVSADGIQLMNINESNLLVNIIGFGGSGLHFIGDGYGVCYNNIYVDRIVNCRTFVKTTAQNNGWTNENRVYGGHYKMSSGYTDADYDTVYFFDLGNTDNYAQDSFHAIHPSIEGVGRLAKIRGRGNYLENVRIEMDATRNPVYLDKFIEFMPGAIQNKISTIYSTMMTYKPTYNYPLTRTGTNQYSIADSYGDLTRLLYGQKHIVLNYSDGTKIDAYVLKSNYTAGSGTTLLLTIDESVKTITGFMCLPIWESTSTHSNAVDIMDSGASGGSYVSFLNDLVKQSTKAKLMFESDSEGSSITYYSGVSSADKIIDTYLYDNTNPFTLLSDGSIIQRRGGSRIETKKLLFDSANTFMYANAMPTSGTYTRGDFLLNRNPAELGTAGSMYVLIGWTCIAGGTPGTWREMHVLTGN